MDENTYVNKLFAVETGQIAKQVKTQTQHAK